MNTSEPQINTILGVPVVTIPLADYADLLSCKSQLGFAYSRGVFEAEGIRDLFNRDPQVAVFVVTRFGLMTAREIMADVKRVFGEERMPPLGSINAFWMQMRPFLPPHMQKAAI